jgi:hypothetical protein
MKAKTKEKSPDEKSIKELAELIKSHGIFQPLIVRHTEQVIENLQRQDIHPLDEAEDSELDVKAGLCNSCYKNTACDSQLFPGMADKRICSTFMCVKKSKIEMLKDELRKREDKK